MDGNNVFDENKISQDSNPPLTFPMQTGASVPPGSSPVPPSSGHSFGHLSFFSSFSKNKLIKAGIGGLIILIIIFLLYQFVIAKILSRKNEHVTLTYWGLWENENVIAPIISDFEAKNPDITVNYSKQDPQQYRQRLISRIQNGTGPDIFTLHNTWLPMLYPIMAPIPTNVISKADVQKFFYPTVINDFTKNGAFYAIPLEIDTLSLYVNTDIFKSAGIDYPKNWNEFEKAARQLTVKDQNFVIKTSGAALGAFDNVTHAPDIISMFLIQSGTDINNLSQSQHALEALSFYIAFATGDQSVWNTSLDPSIVAFAKGNLAMYFGYSYDVFPIYALNPSLQFKILPVPYLDEQNRNMTIASYWAESVSNKSKHQKEAFLFLKYLSQKETEQKLFTEVSKTRLFGEPYARTDLAETLKDNQLVYPFVQQGRVGVSSVFSSDTQDDGINAGANGYLKNAINSILSGTSAQSALDTLSTGLNQIFKQYSQ